MAANYVCLLFDLDGTLMDFGAAEKEAIAGTLTQFELPADEATMELFSKVNADLWSQLEKGKIKKDKLVVRRFSRLLEEISAEGDPIKMNNDYMTRLSNAAFVYPGAEELLQEVAEFATLAVVSNGNQKVQMNRLEKSGLMPYFDEVFVSEKLGVTKPSPKFFELALRKLGIKNKERVLVIGDSLSADIKGGLNAGLDTCWVNFDGSENTSDIQPTYVVESYPQLKLLAVGEEELKLAATREKRHMV